MDLNQTCISSIMMHMNNNVKTSDINENLVRHVILNSLRSYIRQFGQIYGRNMIICCDNRKYWRKSVFPYYKANRKKNREASALDWNMIFDVINKIREELKEFLPYKILDIDGAEADDIIAVLTKKFCNNEKILIISSDKDYVQLQRHGKNVQQYSPNMKRFIHVDNPIIYMREHIIRGDRGDGIPNILSPDSTFISGERQKTINNKKLAEWIKEDDSDSFCITDIMKIGYFRNKILIDFDYIPDNISYSIEQSYEKSVPAPKTKLLVYLASNHMKHLIEVADEF